MADPVDRSGYLIYQTAHLIGRELAKVLDAVHLTPAQFGAMVHTGREPGISAAELARRVNLTPQSTHSALRPLLVRGLMQQRPHPVHGRVLGTYLTPDGIEVAQRASAAVTAMDNRLMDGFDPGERTQLTTLVARLLLRLNPSALDRSSVRVERSG